MRVCHCTLGGTRSCLYCSNNSNYSKDFSIWDLIKDNKNYNVTAPRSYTYSWGTSINTNKED